jgi:PleD family two-component response regulator
LPKARRGAEQRDNFKFPTMSKTQILVIGRHPEILSTVIRLVNNNPAWNATGCITDEEAISAFDKQTFALVLLGGGIEELSEDKLCTYFRANNPDIKIVQHYGGGSGLLSAEIYEALG